MDVHPDLRQTAQGWLSECATAILQLANTSDDEVRYGMAWALAATEGALQQTAAPDRVLTMLQQEPPLPTKSARGGYGIAVAVVTSYLQGALTGALAAGGAPKTT